MNFSELIKWGVGVILAWSAVAHIDDIHRSILKAQAALVYESRTETWGSPRFLKVR